MRGIAPNFLDDPYALTPLGRKQVERAVDTDVNVGELELGLVDVGKALEAPHDLNQPETGFADKLGLSAQHIDGLRHWGLAALSSQRIDELR